MWRVTDNRGGLSDITNLSRIKDSAATLALAILNRPATAQGTHPPPSPMHFAEPPVLTSPTLIQRTSDPVPTPSCSEGANVEEGDER
jgi:hypothetical protein